MSTSDRDVSIGPRALGKLETRQRLRDAARELTEERGYNAVTVAEIASRAGVSVKTLFQHFGSKEELLVAELAEIHDQMIEAVRTRDPSKTPLRAVTDWLIDWNAHRPSDSFDRFMRMVGGGPTVESLRRRLYDDWENTLVDVLADEANEARPTPRTRLIAAQLIAMIRVLTSPESQALLERYPLDERSQAFEESVTDASKQLARGLQPH
jgi:AcrR family transcriptional regulator